MGMLGLCFVVSGSNGRLKRTAYPQKIKHRLNIRLAIFPAFSAVSTPATTKSVKVPVNIMKLHRNKNCRNPRSATAPVGSALAYKLIMSAQAPSTMKDDLPNWIIPAEVNDSSHQTIPRHLNKYIRQNKDLPVIGLRRTLSRLVEITLGAEMRHNLLTEVSKDR